MRCGRHGSCWTRRAARGYVVAMVQDCVFDRLETALALALMETWMKHGHVLELGEVMEYLKTTRRNHADA